MIDLNGVTQFAQIVSAVGPTTIFAFIAFLFLRGDLISSRSLENIIKGITTEIVKQIKDELRDEAPKKKPSEW